MAKTVKKVQKSVLPFYGVAATWVLYALLFPLHQVNQFLLLLVLSGGVFLVMQALCGDQVAEELKKPEKPKKEKSTGNPELDKMIRDGNLAIAEMKRLDENIDDEKISADIRKLESVSRSIFAQVKAQPEKLGQIRKFMDYYLPTTLKILNAYDRMDSAGISGENIDGTKLRVENMMDTIVTAFEKQLDALFGADALDISTDITVLETMMAREGLADEQMEVQTTENVDFGRIRLEL